jgi:hypothetical protein
MRRRLLPFLLLAHLTHSPAARAQTAVPAEVRSEIGAALQQGSARLRFFGLAIYEARLWSLSNLSPEEVDKAPLALEIVYARALDGAQIAQRSLTEMRRQGRFDEGREQRWLQTLKALLPDVKAGDRLTGVQRPGESTRLFLNGSLLGEVRDAQFTRLFFGIWLAPQTSEPALRQQLLGLAP